MTTLDTMTLIWGVKLEGAKRGKPEQADMRLRATMLLAMLEDQAVLLSTIVLAEVLVQIDGNAYQEFMTLVEKKFACRPFDLAASRLAAKLWIKGRGLPQDEQPKRTTLKADTLIIATAAVHGATRYYSHDKKSRKVAELAGLEALDLPMQHPDPAIDAAIRKEFADAETA